MSVLRLCTTTIMVASGSHGSRAPRTVAYVESNDATRERTVSALEAIDGLGVLDAATAAEVRVLLANGTSIDCVVSEYRLDETDGLSLLRELRRRRPDLPFVLYTADGDERLAGEAIAAGVSGYVPRTDEDAIARLVDRVRDAIADRRRAPTDARCERLEAVRDIALELESCSDVEEAHRVAVDGASEVLEGDASALFVDRDSSATRNSAGLIPTALAGTAAGKAFVRSSKGEGLAMRARRSRESFAIDPASYAREGTEDETAEDDRPPEDETTEDERVRSVVTVPISGCGVLQAVSTTSDAFGETALQAAELLGVHVSSTIERLRSERAHRSERDRFAGLFESVPDAVAFTTEGDSETIQSVNPAFERIFGYDTDDLAGESLDDLIVPENSDSIVVYDEVGLDEVVTAEVTRLAADGPREFLFRGFATEVDETVHEYAIYTDVPERKHRERDRELYETLVDTVGDPMYVLDGDGHIEMVNDAMVDRLGYSRAELVGEHVSGFMSTEDVERGTRLLLNIARDDTRRWGTYEMAFVHADGTRVETEDNVAPLVDGDGALRGSVGVLRDITDRKARERRVRSLHDGTRQLMAAQNVREVAEVATDIAAEALDLPINGVYLYDSECDSLIPIAATEYTRELIGEPPVIEAGGGLAWDAYQAGEPMAHGDVTAHAGVRNPETPIRSEAHIPLGEHGVFIVGSTEVNDFDEESLTLAKILAANVEAALERAERESELNDRQRELERQNDRLEQFAGTVSHDLRNPLTLADGHVELAREEAEVAKSVEAHLAEVSWALDRMNDLIEDVLLLARSGQHVTDTEPVSLGALVDRARRTVDPSLEVAVDGELPTIEADENRLLVCLENLFRNAREHGDEDVTVTVGGTDEGFFVADDGPGISSDERESVFESGYTTNPEGTGFGLAIVSEAVEAHGWSIAAGESDTGGARFDVRVE